MNKYRKADGKYNGLIRILTNPLFLQACYLEIKSKGNMTPSGTNKDTLDGIKLKWFENTASDLLSGRFNFAPARRVMIPALALPLRALASIPPAPPPKLLQLPPLKGARLGRQAGNRVKRGGLGGGGDCIKGGDKYPGEELGGEKLRDVKKSKPNFARNPKANS